MSRPRSSVWPSASGGPRCRPPWRPAAGPTTVRQRHGERGPGSLHPVRRRRGRSSHRQGRRQHGDRRKLHQRQRPVPQPDCGVQPATGALSGFNLSFNGEVDAIVPGPTATPRTSGAASPRSAAPRSRTSPSSTSSVARSSAPSSLRASARGATSTTSSSSATAWYLGGTFTVGGWQAPQRDRRPQRGDGGPRPVDERPAHRSPQRLRQRRAGWQSVLGPRRHARRRPDGRHRQLQVRRRSAARPGRPDRPDRRHRGRADRLGHAAATRRTASTGPSTATCAACPTRPTARTSSSPPPVVASRTRCVTRRRGSRPTRPAPTSSRPGSPRPVATRCGGSRSPTTRSSSAATSAGGTTRYGVDSPRPGAVPRPGLMALDPVSGRPLEWNPGRNPPGKAVYALLATSEGCTSAPTPTGSATASTSGRRSRFFPYPGGDTSPRPRRLASRHGLPRRFAGSTGATNVLYRVNAGGGAIAVARQRARLDGRHRLDQPATATPAATRPAGTPIRTVDVTVPATTPRPSSTASGGPRTTPPRCSWAFPVPAGTPVQVRLYLANRCSCTSTAGQRVSTSPRRPPVLTNFDIVADVGDQPGTMRAFDAHGDGTVNIDFAHVVENPLVNGIEIVRTDVAPLRHGDGRLSRRARPRGSARRARGPRPARRHRWATPVAPSWSATPSSTAPPTATCTADLRRRHLRAAVQIDPYHDPPGRTSTTTSAAPSTATLPTLVRPDARTSRACSTALGGCTTRSTVTADSSGGGSRPTAASSTSAPRTVAARCDFSDAGGMFADGGKLFFVAAVGRHALQGRLRRRRRQRDPRRRSAARPSTASTGANRSMFLYGGPALEPGADRGVRVLVHRPACALRRLGVVGPGRLGRLVRLGLRGRGTATGKTPQPRLRGGGHVHGDAHGHRRQGCDGDDDQGRHR